MAYPKASNNSVYAAASRLMARPDVSAWIAETEQRMHDRVMRQVEQEQGDTLKEQLLTINQKRAVLTKIITGETKRVRHIKTKYSYEKVEDDLPIYAVLRAIDMDTRLENFYNLLSNPDTWRRTQNVYVNTPTLQQQVNVLINQTTEQNKKDQMQVNTYTQHKNNESKADLPFKVGGCPHVTGSTSAQETCALESDEGIDSGLQEKGSQSVSVPLLLNNTAAPQKTPHYLTKLNKSRDNPLKAAGVG